MKPLGTITACFSFIDDETRVILQSVMDESENYNDFAERLYEKAIQEPLPDLAIYFTYYHCYNQDKYNFLTKLIDAGIKTEFTYFFGLVVAHRGGETIEWTEYQKAMFSALKHVENDWMACHVYIAWRSMVEVFGLPEVAIDNETLDILASKIKNNEEYGFFLSQIHRITAMRLAVEGNLKDAIKYYDKAITQAKKYDDRNELAELLFEKANKVKHSNFNEALGLLEIMRNISDELGSVMGTATYLHELGHIAMAKGEFEKAIAYQNQYKEGRLDRGLSIGLLNCVIAFIYNQKGDGKTALALINESRDEYPSESRAMCQIQTTWAYLLLDEIDRGSQYLEKARSSSLKSGEETTLSQIHFLEGLFAKKQGDSLTAIFSFKNPLEFYERTNTLTHLHYILIEMVDTEIEIVTPKKDSARLEDSGPWMRKLLNHVEGRDLPGTAAQAKLLLAKFRFKQGRIKESRKLVDEVLKISEKTGMHFLKDKAELLVPELILS